MTDDPEAHLSELRRARDQLQAKLDERASARLERQVSALREENQALAQELERANARFAEVEGELEAARAQLDDLGKATRDATPQ